MPMKTLKIFILTFYSILYSISYVSATHIVGGEFKAKSLGNRFYEVSLKLYRDCAGIQLCGSCQGSGGFLSTCNHPISIFGAQAPSGVSHNLPTQSCTGVSFGTQSIPVVNSAGVYDPLQLCNLSKSICNNCNTRTPGTFTPGIEVYSFKGNINLSSLPASCCWVSLGFGPFCCRNNGITSLANPSATALFLDIQLNICQGAINETPSLTTDAGILATSNLDFTFSPGAFDPDGDSLSFMLGSARQGLGQNNAYAPNYSSSAPFPFLGFPHPNLSAPSGIQLNTTNGHIRFRPVGSFLAYFVLEVFEWRRINGVPTLLSRSTKEYQFYSSNTYTGSNPNINVYHQGGLFTAQSINPCLGNELCFNIASNFSGLNGNDTTDLEVTLASAIGVATITRPYNVNTRSINGPRHDTLTVCVSGLRNDSGFQQRPYFLNITAKNRACPKPASFVRVITINKSLGAPVVINKQSGFFSQPIQASLQYPVNASIVNDSTQWFFETAPKSNIFNQVSAGSDTLKNAIPGTGGWFGIKARLFSPTCGRFTISDSVFVKPMQLEIVKVNSEKCKGDSNGQIIINKIGGVGPVLTNIRPNNSLSFIGQWQSSDTINKLTNRNYIVVIRDSLNNSDSLPVFVNLASPSFVAGASTLTHIKCFGDSSGSIAAVFTGGDSLGVRYYSTDSATWQNSNLLTNLPAGNVKIWVKDSTGCLGNASFTLTQKPLLVGSTNLVQTLKCKGDSNAAIILTASGGTAPYQVKVGLGSYSNNFSSNLTLNNLKAGQPQIVLKDSNGCLSNIFTTITEPAQSFDVSVTATQPVCAGQNGAITLNAAGGIPPYQYWLFGTNPGSNNVFSNVTPGNKIAYARDSNQCVKSVAVAIVSPVALTLAANTKQISCLGDTNGSVTLVGNGGRRPYLFKLGNGAFAADSVFRSLGSGSYLFTMKDSGGCEKGVTALLQNRTQLISNISTTPESCAGAKMVLQ